MQRNIVLAIEELENDGLLDTEDKELVDAARKAIENSYSPYSGFKVAAAARLQDGNIVTGTNQENAAYPVGICAERTLLSAVAAFYPNMPIKSMAVTYFNSAGPSDSPITPCGICRQSLTEYEQRTHQPIRLLLTGNTGKVWMIPKASMLLPLGFSSDDMSLSI